MAENDFSEILAEMLIRMDRQQSEIKQTNEILRTVVDVQNRMLGQMELIYNNQQQFNAKQEDFNDRQEAFNARQEEVNLAILQELRVIKTDVRELKEERESKKTIFDNHEERLRRLEEFMRKAS